MSFFVRNKCTFKKLFIFAYTGDKHRGFGCQFEIEDGGHLTVPGPFFVSGDNPVFNLYGEVNVHSLIIDNHGKFTVASTGKVVTSSLKLYAWTDTTVALYSVFGSDSNKMAVENIEIGFASNVNFDHSELIIEANTFKMDAMSKLIVKGDKKKVDITTANFTIQDRAVIDVSAGGELDTAPGSSAGSEGASYGGEGGSHPGSTYGSAVAPVDYGSGTATARGGGIVSVTANLIADIDGSLIANGQSSSGGASGGTISVKASVLQGHGKLSCNGGNSPTGSGGGGGRISLNAPSLSKFLGDVTAYGGSGPNSNGAAGTIYKQYEKSGGSKITEIVVDNNGKKTDSLTHINGINDLTKLDIKGYGQVQFDGTTPTDIGTISGDYTGTLKIFARQVMTIATSYGTLTPYALMCKLIIKEEGRATIPPMILLTDDDTTGQDWYNLELYGTVIGVREITISYGGRALFHSKSRSGLSSDNIKPVGTLSFNKIDVTTNGILELSLDSMSTYTLQMIKELNVKYGGLVVGRNLDIQSPILHIAYGGHLSVDSGNSCQGSGSGDSGSTGAGGSHGGAGGISSTNIKPSANHTGVINNATDFGSAGGAGSTNPGGKGGGYIKIVIKKLLNLHGTISADGENTGNDGGGGSGGGIKIIINGDMEGSGEVSVRGGSSRSGGAGGGGRVFIQVDGSFDYLGSYKLCGGVSSSGQAGGSGSSYVVFKQTGIPGYVEYLYLDNSCASGTSQGVTYIDLPKLSLYSLNSFNIADKTKVWFTTVGLHFKARTLNCGSKSTIVVDDHVVFSANMDLSYSAISCSFDLKQDGELRLPNTVELKGESNTLQGKLCVTTLWIWRSWV